LEGDRGGVERWRGWEEGGERLPRERRRKGRKGRLRRRDEVGVGVLVVTMRAMDVREVELLLGWGDGRSGGVRGWRRRELGLVEVRRSLS